ncbi:hypothetical protein EON63_05960 [archaeon]|nr:MAG: hypothetical protein EON63_05960 [archaeon]
MLCFVSYTIHHTPYTIHQEEERKAEEAEKRKNKESEVETKISPLRGAKLVKDAWVEYRDKKTRKNFFYNTITRKSQFEVPKDFVADRTRLVREVTFGMSFYH